MVFHVQGKLIATNTAAVNEDTRNMIRRAVARHSLTLAITDIHRGNIIIDGTFGFFGKQGTENFRQTLSNFIQDENLHALQLQGQLLITEENETGTIRHQLTISEGQMLHDETLNYSEQPKPMSV